MSEQSDNVDEQRLEQLLRQMLKASQESNTDLRRQLEEQSGDVARLVAENRRLTQQVEDLQRTQGRRTADAVADATRASQAEMNELGNSLELRDQQLRNSEQIVKDLLQVAEIPSKKAKKEGRTKAHREEQEPRPGKVYGVEAGKNVAQLLSVKPTPDTKELAAIVRYEDGVYEIVPTAVVAHHAHEDLIRFYESLLRFT